VIDGSRFRYWTPDGNKYKPYKVSRYVGAKKGLLTDAQILRRARYSTQPELNILKANALQGVTAGRSGPINTWDDQIVSWGMAQFAGHAGTLAAPADRRSRTTRAARPPTRVTSLAGGHRRRRTARIRTSIASSPRGLARGPCAHGSPPTVRRYAGDDGWKYMRTQPRLIGAF
jgi:hypothetical protein